MRKALGAAVLILALATSGTALGATLKEVRLRPGPRASELILVLDRPVLSRVQRSGEAVVLCLPDTGLGAGAATGGLADERVQAVSVEQAPGGELAVRVRPKAGLRLGYVHLREAATITVRLFQDAPAAPPGAPEQAAQTAKAASPGPKAKKPSKAQAKVQAKKPAPQQKAVSQAAPAPRETASSSKPEPPKPQQPKPKEPPPLLAARPEEAAEPAAQAKEELAELPGDGPDIGGLLPGTRPRRDELARRLTTTRESQAAYEAASLKLKAKDYQEALGLFRKLETDFPGTLQASRSAFRAADCLYGLATASGKGAEGAEGAIQAYLAAVSKWPLQDEVGRAYLQIGRLYQMGGYEYEALGYLGLAIKHQPDSVYALLAYLSRGDLYFKKGKYREAAAEYTEVGRRFPNSAQVREANFKLVRSLFALRDFEGVERAYGEMRQRWPETFATDPELLRYIGETYFQQGDYTRCRQFLFYVLNIYPDSGTNHLLLAKIGDSFMAEGRPLEAAKIYKLVVSTYPGTEGAHLAQMRLAENDVAEGKRLIDGLASGDNRLGELKLYEELAASGGTTAQKAKVRIGLWHYWRRDYLKAAEVLQQLLTRESLPEDLAKTCRYAIAESLFRQVRTYYQQGRYKDAVKLHGAWGEWFEGGERAELYYYLGECFRRSHLAQEAAELFLKAQGRPWREDRRQETLYGLGLARLEMGDYLAAARNLREAAEAFPDHPWRSAALRALGRAYYLGGKHDQAVMALEEGLRHSTEMSAKARDCQLLGLALMELKDYQRAAAAFQEAISAGKTAGSDARQQAAASLELGNALYNLQRWDEAIRAYRYVAQLAPGSPEAQQALYKTGKSYLAVGRRQEAAEAFRAGAEGESGIWKKASAQMLGGINLGAQAP